MVVGRAALAALFASGLGPGVSAVPSEIASPLRIDCPTLDRETRAAFEARARAELALSPRPEGEIAVACEQHAAHVGWRAASGRTAERDIGLAADPATAVDSLLGAVHALRAGIVTQPAALADRGVAVEAAAPPLLVAAVPAAGARGHRVPFRLGVEAGVYGEVWEGSVAGGVEGQFGLRFDNRNHWEIALTGGIGRAVQVADGWRANTASISLGVAHLPVPNLEVEAGGLLRVLTLERSIFDVPSQTQSSTLGLFAAVRYVLASGRFAMAFGPHLSLLQDALVAHSDGSEIFRVPRFVTGLSLAGRADFVR